MTIPAPESSAAILKNTGAILQRLLNFNERSTKFQRSLKHWSRQRGRHRRGIHEEVRRLLGAGCCSLRRLDVRRSRPCSRRTHLAPEPPRLEEVTVTARRREESLQDVPIAVSAFSAERIESTGAPDITWLQQSTPNLTLQVARGTNSTLIAFIRGIGQQDPLWGFEPGVGLYVDDVYIARPQGAVLDIYDIERLEVLRGPQGTLYGRNTIGGAIKYVTRQLGNEARLDTKLTLGTYAPARFHRLGRAARERHALARRAAPRSTAATATARTSSPASRTTMPRTSTRSASAPTGARRTR